MYSKLASGAAAGSAGTATLASTGMEAWAFAVAGATLLFAGAALLKILPPRRK